MRGGVIRAKNDGSLNQFHGEVMMTRLLGEDAKEVQRIGMVWLAARICR